MEKKICCISAKADWEAAFQLCRSVKDELGISVDVLSARHTVQNYDVVIYVHSSRCASDAVINKWLKEASDLNKTFLPVILGGNIFSDWSVKRQYKGPNLRTPFLMLRKDKDMRTFMQQMDGYAGAVIHNLRGASKAVQPQKAELISQVITSLIQYKEAEQARRTHASLLLESLVRNTSR